MIQDNESINKIASHHTKCDARRVNHLLDIPLSWKRNLTVATNAKEFSLEKSMIIGQLLLVHHFPSSSHESVSQIYRRARRKEARSGSPFRKKRRVRVFTRENDALGRGRIDGSIEVGCTGDIKLNPDTESVTVERRIRKRSLGIDKIVSPAVIRFTTSNKSRSRRGRSPGLILVDLAPALVPRYCRSLPFNEETSTGWTRPRFTFQHVPPLILLFDPSIPSLR